MATNRNVMSIHVRRVELAAVCGTMRAIGEQVLRGRKVDDPRIPQTTIFIYILVQSTAAGFARKCLAAAYSAHDADGTENSHIFH